MFENNEILPSELKHLKDLIAKKCLTHEITDEHQEAKSENILLSTVM